jgi:UDPglucose 6-dehydrogenase
MGRNNMKKLKLAVIGHGFVGGAVDYGFNNRNIQKYIIDPKLGTKIEDVPDDLDIAFICVPTPMGDDGSVDSSIVESAVATLAFCAPTALIVVKSTVTPDVINSLYNQYPTRFVYNPEFLTEKSANEDFVNPIMHIFGGDEEPSEELEKIYHKYSSCKPCPVHYMSAMDASFVKYGINCFLMNKVLWFNQFFDIVTASGANYGSIINAIGTDKRVSPSHTLVPGFDGRRGAAGPCFAKDIPAFIKYSKDVNSKFTILEEAARRNQDYRNQYSDRLDREKAQNIRFDLEI